MATAKSGAQMMPSLSSADDGGNKLSPAAQDTLYQLLMEGQPQTDPDELRAFEEQFEKALAMLQIAREAQEELDDLSTALDNMNAHLIARSDMFVGLKGVPEAEAQRRDTEWLKVTGDLLGLCDELKQEVDKLAVSIDESNTINESVVEEGEGLAAQIESDKVVELSDRVREFRARVAALFASTPKPEEHEYDEDEEEDANNVENDDGDEDVDDDGDDESEVDYEKFALQRSVLRATRKQAEVMASRTTPLTDTESQIALLAKQMHEQLVLEEEQLLSRPPRLRDSVPAVNAKNVNVFAPPVKKKKQPSAPGAKKQQTAPVKQSKQQQATSGPLKQIKAQPPLPQGPSAKGNKQPQQQQQQQQHQHQQPPQPQQPQRQQAKAPSQTQPPRGGAKTPAAKTPAAEARTKKFD